MSFDHRYDDMLRLPHPLPEGRPVMSLEERAAQFAAFKALTGYEEEIEEEARYTETAVELDESRKEQLNALLLQLWEHRGEGWEAEFIWFQPDERKSGGAYRHSRGVVKGLKPLERLVLLSNGERLPLDALRDIRCEALEAWESREG